MGKTSKGFCTACVKENLKCDRGKSRCKNCLERGAKCTYPLKLRWGGRQYKNGFKESNIPNTKVYKGALLVKNKRLIVGKRIQTIRQFLPFEEKSNSPKKEDDANNLIKGEIKELSLATPKKKLVQTKEDLACKLPCVERFSSFLPPDYLIDFAEHSWEVSTLFNLFVNETSQFFIGLNSEVCPNPYKTILPRMALSCPTLLKLLVAFAAKHRRMIGLLEGENMFQSLEDGEFPVTDFESIGENLLRQALKEVNEKLKHSVETFDEHTMAIVLLLSSLYIFSSEGGGDWRIHYNGAKIVAFKRLKLEENVSRPVIFYNMDYHPRAFLLRWFIYLDVVGCLSSASFTCRSDEAFRPQIDFSVKDDFNLNRRMMENLEDINPLSGMDCNIFAFLKDVGQLIMQRKRYCEFTQADYKIIAEAIELDYKISNYLKTSEQARDHILRKCAMSNDSFPSSRTEDYKLMRSTNLIIGLTGILQLRRRVMDMSQESKLVEGLVSQIAKLVVEKIPVHSQVLSSILFCLFVVGCELIDDRMISYRQAYLARLESLWRRGFKNVSQAVRVMEECWRSKKAWWVVLEEKNLDICLAL